MIIPELKNLMSPDLDHGLLPPDAKDCEVYCQVEIGPRGTEGADTFALTVVTPKHLAKQTGYVWGKGYLIVESFSWQTVEKAIEKLLAHCSGTDWIEVAGKLNSMLGWEFENYTESSEH